MSNPLEDLTEKQIYHKIYYMENKERLLEQRKQWAKNNPEKAKSYHKKYLQELKTENNEKYRERNRKNHAMYYQNHREEVCAKRRERYQKEKQAKEMMKSE